MTASKTRAEFEAWFRKEHPNGWPIARFNGSGQYVHMHPADNWTVWQAARRATLDEAAQYLGEMHAKAKSQHNYYAYAANCISALADEEPKP